VDRGSILLSEFYKAGTKMTPRSRVGIGVLESRVNAIDPILCDYGKDLEDSGSNTGQRRQQTGLKWAQAGRPRPFRGPVAPPFDLGASRAIHSPLTESHASINSSSAAEEQRSLRDTISEMRVVLVV
jgi:hypothetical protein